MIPYSLRWRLFLWYALIFILALAALIKALDQILTEAWIRDADSVLELRMSAVQHKIEEYPAVQLSDELAGALAEGLDLRVWDQNAVLIADLASRRRALEIEVAEAETRPTEGYRDAGSRRVLVASGPHGTWILLGLDVSEERARVSKVVRTLGGAALVVLGVALLGGWFVMTTTLGSIGAFSAAARRISAQNLGARIDLSALPSELLETGETLNASFDRLEAAFERQTRFTADASHELRTPLAIIQAHLELAASRRDSGLVGATEESEIDARIATSLRATRRMQGVVDGLLTLARAEASGAELEFHPIRFGELVLESAESCRPLADDAGISIQVRIEEVPVSGDEERLRELVTNLCTNAIRHNSEGGAVEVELRRNEDRAELRVSDRGPGIAAEFQARIFERFYRIDKARTRRSGGSGLGLAISKWIVEQHGGEIEVESALGQGAAFVVTLPVSGQK